MCIFGDTIIPMVRGKTITTKLAEISKEENFIRLKFFNSNEDFDLEEAKMQYNAASELCNGKPYKVLIDVRGVDVSPQKEAQDFLSHLDEKIAEAIIVNSLALRILSKFYKNKSSNNPVKIFSKEEKAIEWLLQQ